MPRRPEEITQLLQLSADGDAAAMDDLLELVYEDLHRLAARQLASEQPGVTLSATMLVNEAYLKLRTQTGSHWNDRQHFFRLVSQSIRNIAVDHARQRLAQKRGSGEKPLLLNEDQQPSDERAGMILEMDDALETLRETEPDLVLLIECRFYAGLTEVETAEALGISRRTVQRQWLDARERLKDLLS